MLEVATIGYDKQMRFIKWLTLKLFRLSGWRVEGNIPEGIQKAIIVGAPHTSNWDLFYTLGLMFTLDRRFRLVIKKEALVFPIKGLLLGLGAYPIARTKQGTNLVDQIAKIFEEDQECCLCIAPEGTRKAVTELKTGFYHIANKAGVALVVGYPDCDNKVVHIGQLLDSSKSEDEVIRDFKTILKQAVAKRPENFTLLDGES